MKPAYYNEFNKHAAEWLCNLIAAGLIPDGEVDTRSIEDVHPSDLQGFVQCHFFAGIGGWPLALRSAGWADDRPVWTGSCPCQPFSSAGEGAGFADERHLWPHFYHLISAHRDWCRQQKRIAPILLGEQVASKDADAWIDLVCADLEALGDAFATIPFPSASVGAPHIRDRNYWVGYPDGSASGKGRANVRGRAAGGNAQSRSGLGGAGMPGGLAYADGARSYGQRRQPGERVTACAPGSAQSGAAGWLDNAICLGLNASRDNHGKHDRIVAGSANQSGWLADAYGGHASAERQQRGGEQRLHSQHAGVVRPGGGGGEDRAGIELGPGPINGMWRDADWLFCRDAKWRPVEAGTFPLADGLPRSVGSSGPLSRAKSYRVGALRGYGNAINPEQATEFIRAVMEAA